MSEYTGNGVHYLKGRDNLTILERPFNDSDNLNNKIIESKRRAL